MLIYLTTPLQAFNYLHYLPGVVAEVEVYPLRLDEALGINDDKTHLGHAGHRAHRLAGFGQHIVLAGNPQVFIVEDG